jgi:hypothetical protein
MSFVPNFRRFMSDMTHEMESGRVTETEANLKVCEFIQNALRCATVSIWDVSGSPGSRVMRRAAGFDGVRGVGGSKPAVFPERGGGYFNVLVRDGCYIASDTWSDPSLEPIREPMLVPYNIRSLLSAGFGSNGEVTGIITCTDTMVRKWLPAEVTALRRCAAEVSLRRARRDARHRIE